MKNTESISIFFILKNVKRSRIPVFFNFNRDYPDIIWGKYEMQIDIEQRAGFKKPMLEIFCDGGLLKLCDYRENQTPETAQGKFCDGLTSEDCMQIIEKILKNINSTP